jgi:hypothetical protein
MKVLEYEFARDPEWTKDRLYELSRMTGLSEGQIYKWGWDQKKKLASGEITLETLQRIREAGPPQSGNEDDEDEESEGSERKRDIKKRLKDKKVEQAN